MTVYPGTHNARAAARDSHGRGLPVDAIAQTLKVSVMPPLRWRREDERGSVLLLQLGVGCHGQFGGRQAAQLAVRCACVLRWPCHKCSCTQKVSPCAGRLGGPSSNLAQTPKARRVPACGFSEIVGRLPEEGESNALTT